MDLNSAIKQFSAIEDDSEEQGWADRYLKTRPKDRILTVVHEGKPKILDYIGPKLDYLYDVGLLEECFESECDGVVSGVYIWEGIYRSDPHYCWEYGIYEYEEYLEGEFRLATEEEWQAHLNEEYPWDRSLWLKQEELKGKEQPKCLLTI